MFSADFAVFHILYDVCTHALPIYSFSGEVLHLLDVFMASIEITEYSLVQFRRYTCYISFSKLLSVVNSLLIPQNWHAMWGTSWNHLGHPFNVMQWTV